MDWLFEGMLAALGGAAGQLITALWDLLDAGMFISPDASQLPQVAALSNRSTLIVNACFVLAVITAGATVMTHGSIQVRYGIGELAPRLLLGFLGANFATPLCRGLVAGANSLTEALTGDSLRSQDSFKHILRVLNTARIDTTSALLLAVLGLIVAGLTGMLVILWLARLGVLVVWFGVAPLALACHATPFTDPIARLWWRTGLGCLATVTLQALALHVTVDIFLDPDANLAALGLPADSNNMINLFIVCCLLWVVVRIPALVRRHVSSGGDGGGAVTMARVLLMQAVTAIARVPVGGRAAASAARRGRGAMNPPGSVATTIIPFWKSRMPRPTPGGGGAAGLATGGRRSTSASSAAGASTGSTPRSTPRSTRPPIRAAGVTATSPPTGPRPVIPPGVNPATAMPKTRPVRPPVTGPWNRPSMRGAGVTPPPAAPRQVVPPGLNPATAMPKVRPVRPPVTGPWNRSPRRP
ncbi:hypothetical protein GCM10009558_097120 [Virgisporangium aurantiacum]